MLRGLIALLFAAPAAVAGYHATLALARIGVPAEGWREVFAIAGTIAIGTTAVVRVAGMAYPSGVRRVSVAMSDQSQMATTPSAS